MSFKKTQNEFEESWSALLILIELVKESYNDASRIFQDFENEVISKNRFFPNVEKIEKILEAFTNEANYTLQKGAILYRARIIHENDLNKCKIQELLNNPSLLPKKTTILKKPICSSYVDNIKSLSNILKPYPQMNPDLTNILEQTKQEDFWGFSSKDSDAPPVDKATVGRINPYGISYLYTAEAPNTAIAEIRPKIDGMVSVAEVEIQKELRLYDFCANIIDNDGTRSNNISIFDTIAKRFATPNQDREVDYYSTQYISEMLKEKFDGIRFSSSLHKGGINIVLFDIEKNEMNIPKNYIIKNSSFHLVREIEISAERLLPNVD